MDLVRIQVEVLDPGCKIVGQTNIPMYIHPPRPFLSRPPKPKWRLGETMDTIVMQERVARLHFQSIGTGIDLVTLGDLDFLLTLKTEEELFDPWVEKFIELAVKEGMAVEQYYKQWCHIAGFDVDVEAETIRFVGWLPEGEELRTLATFGRTDFK